MSKQLDLMPFYKGQVWMLSGEEWSQEQRNMGITVGDRPVVIYNTISVFGDFVTILPCTSATGRNGVFVNLEEGILSTVLVQEIRPVHISRLTRFLGNLSSYVMDQIDSAVKIYLGLEYNEEKESKYFPKIRNKREKIQDSVNAYTTTKRPIINVDEHNGESHIEEDNVITNRRGQKLLKIDVYNLSDDEKNYIITAKASDIAERYNISISTAYHYKKMFNRKKVEVPAKPIFTYSSTVYQCFANKKLSEMSEQEKELFTKLDPDKLSTYMKLPVSAIKTAQSAFSK